ncbi:MAG: PQQ-dependent sugar dehydrogenase [Ferruginibacter sp.]
MKKCILIISLAVLLLLYFTSCNSGPALDTSSISTDTATIAKGEASFIQYCSSCHNFRQGSIGPQLGGLTDSVATGWIRHFIRDPMKIIESGDLRAQQLFKKYKVAMPSFAGFTDDEVNGIIAFMHTYKAPDRKIVKGDGKELSNPIPDTVRLSNLVVGLELVTQIPPSGDSGKLPLTRITKLDFEPNSGSSFILDLRGKLYRLQNNKPIVYMDMAKLKPAFIHEAGLGTGFGSFAFHPEFAKNGLLYTTHSEAPGSGKADFSYADSIKVTLQYVLTEWKADKPGAATFSGTSRELLRVNMVYVIHGIQEISFNPFAKPGNKDYGMLYLGVGDGGVVETGYPFLTHSLEKIWGTILRIDPAGHNSANGKYGIPEDNPFAKDQNTKTLREIYAWGFKNPHRITWGKAGQILVCNIGEGNIESVNLILPGHDYGWPIREGTFVLNPYGDLTKVYPLPANDSIYHITYPIAQYDHDGGWTAIAGGYEYTGKAIPKLKGKFIFGDIASGRLFYIEMADIKQGKLAPIKEWKFSINGIQRTFKAPGSELRVDMHFGRDAQGELYILVKPDGKVYKLVSASIKE